MKSSNTFFWYKLRYCYLAFVASHSSTFCSFFSKAYRHQTLLNYINFISFFLNLIILFWSNDLHKYLDKAWRKDVSASEDFVTQIKKHRAKIHFWLSGGAGRINARSGRVILDFFVSFFVRKKRKRKRNEFIDNTYNRLNTDKCCNNKNRKHLSQIFLLAAFFIFSFTAHAQQKSLDYFINQGIQNSPLLKENNNNILLNRIDSLRIAASYKPQVNGISNNYYAPIVKGYGYDEVITNLRNFSEQISVSKLLVSKRSLRIQFNGIQLLNDSLSTAGKITEQDLKRTITAAYIAAYGSWRQYSFNEEVYNLLSKEDTILKKLTQASVYRQTDYLTFLVTLQQQHLTITQSRIQYLNDFATLNYFSGLFDTTLTPLDSPRIGLAQLPEIAGSIFYRKFNTDSLLLVNAGELTDLAYKPRVNLSADGGFVSSLYYTPYKNVGGSVGINVNVPIYDGKQRKLLHRRLDILEQTRVNYRDYFAAQYSQQIAQLSQQLSLTKQLINETNEQLKYVRALIQANQKLLATGDVRISDYVIAINNYLNAQNVITQNIVSQFQIITQINYWNRK